MAAEFSGSVSMRKRGVDSAAWIQLGRPLTLPPERGLQSAGVLVSERGNEFCGSGSAVRAFLRDKYRVPFRRGAPPS